MRVEFRAAHGYRPQENGLQRGERESRLSPERAAKKIDEIDRRIHQLETMKDELSALVEKCIDECRLTGLAKDCVILDAMDDSKSVDGHVVERNSSKRRNHAASR